MVATTEKAAAKGQAGGGGLSKREKETLPALFFRGFPSLRWHRSIRTFPPIS